jgi:hypothetical protein
MVWTTGTEISPSYEDVSLRTGRQWREWQAILDAWEGDKAHLRPMVSYLIATHHLNQFWAQVIALYYLIENV